MKVTQIPEGVKRISGIAGCSQKINNENFPSTGNATGSQILEGQGNPNRFDLKLPSHRHIITKHPSAKGKDKILKQAHQEDQIAYRGTPIRLTVDFSEVNLQARREWSNIYQILKKKKLNLE